MTKAIFDKKPTKVSVVVLDGTLYAQLRLNPTKVTAENEEGKKETYYEVDWHEFHAPEGYYDAEDITKHPEDYTEAESFDTDDTDDHKSKTTPEIVIENKEAIGTLRADIDYLLMINGEE